MSRVVVSQSMYFPWVGMLEQIRLADTVIHFDDVQFVRKSFFNRTQVKTSAGISWMTVPLSGYHRGQTIDEIRIKPVSDWGMHHLGLLKESVRPSPSAGEALDMLQSVLAEHHESLSGLARASMMALCRYFGLDRDTRFCDSRDFGVDGSASERLLALVKAVGGTDYITGHGARNYLDHALFEANGVTVSYMDYRRTPYPQPHGAFTPYVSGLDLVANCARGGADFIASGTRNWKDFLNEPT